MKLYDLSHPLNYNTPVFPGSKQPYFTSASNIESDGYRETLITINSHLGTHIDAPAHIIEKGVPLDKMPLEAFTGTAVIITVPERAGLIQISFLEHYTREIRAADFVLFKTNHCKYWGTPAYFDNFPVPDLDAINWLTGFSLKGIGFDTISADKMESTELENHHVVLSKGMIIIENLHFPEDMTTTSGRFFCFPLPYENADGCPIRAVLEIE
ncbi:MAG TPA: cyclase family protein [Mariniphaga sp.]|nr:cyclase family protein [Mariniphaga sp.]